MIRKVLFVYDDQTMLLLKEKYADSYQDSFTMDMAEDALDAGKKLKDGPVFLIVIDLKQSYADGMGFLAHVREKYPDIAVVIVSESRTAELDKLVKDGDIAVYICKPFPIEALGNIIMHRLRKESDGGIMHNVSPSTFLQLMEMESKTGTIRMIDNLSTRGGVLYFIDGRLLDARAGELKGLDAAYQAFGWEKVTVFIQNVCRERGNVINSDLQSIILKAVGMKDENGDSLYTGEKPGSESKLNEIRELLIKEVGGRSGIEDIYPDETMGEVVTFMGELGALFNLGKFKVGYVENDQENKRVVLPEQPPIVLRVSPNGSYDKSIKVLIDYYPA